MRWAAPPFEVILMALALLGLIISGVMFVTHSLDGTPAAAFAAVSGVLALASWGVSEWRRKRRQLQRYR